MTYHDGMPQPPDLFEYDDASWQSRLEHIVETMRQVSLQTTPEDMTRTYTERMSHSLPSDRFLSLTRRDVEAPDFIVARKLDGNESQPEVNPLRERHKLPRLTGGLLSELLYSNAPHVIEDLAVPPDDPAAVYLEGYRSLVAIPVFDGGESLNMIVLLHRDPRTVNKRIIPQMVWTTNLFGRAAHNLVLNEKLTEAYEMVDREMRVISEIQRALLPERLPDVPTLDLAVHYRPAARAGGDYYDFFPLRDDRLGVLIADVSGHGSPAAVLMAITHALAHTKPDETVDPGHLLRYVNHHLARRYTYSLGSFVTAFFGIYCPHRRTLAYAAAGHPPPRVKRCADGSTFVLDAEGGLPLGILDDTTYASATQQLSVGDQIVFYTDGISEAFNPDDAMFGVARLDDVLEDCALSAQGLIDSVLQAVDEFTQGRAPDDDRTLMVAKVT